MKTLVQGWNFMRFLRLGLGIAILVQGIMAKEALTIILGAVFGGMAVANIGCCGAGTCAVKSVSNNKKAKQ